MSVEDVIEAVHGTFTGDKSILSFELSGMETDSRNVYENCIFAAICGAKTDGHDYINKAFEDGALICIGQKEIKDDAIESGKGYIKVKDTPLAIGDIAREYMNRLNIPIIGVTGSVGKTGTKETIAAVLEQGMSIGKTIGNHNNEIGLPLTILTFDSDMQVGVLEMGISAPDEMDYLLSIASPSVAVITNIGVSHIENLGSRHGIFEEKSKIYKDIPDDGLVLLNGDDDILKNTDNLPEAPVIFYGLNPGNDIYADNIRPRGLKGTDFTICGLKDGDLEVSVNIPGMPMIQNSLAAAAIASHFGLGNEAIKKGLQSCSTVAGRTRIFTKGGVTVIDDCYNASPISMKSAIDTLSLAEGRKICVLGDMFELGDDSRSMHYEVGRYAAMKQVDVLFTCGELSVDIARGALCVYKDADIEASLEDEYVEIMMTNPEDPVVPEFYIFKDNDELINKLKDFLSPGDCVLIKASNSMNFESIVKSLEQ